MNTIAYFQEQQCKSTTTMEQLQHYNKAIFALSRREPKLVNHERTFWTYKHYCPSCCEQIRIEYLRYCDRCGQCLDWSNYEEGLKYVRKTHR